MTAFHSYRIGIEGSFRRRRINPSQGGSPLKHFGRGLMAERFTPPGGGIFDMYVR